MRNDACGNLKQNFKSRKYIIFTLVFIFGQIFQNTLPLLSSVSFHNSIYN